MRVLGAGLAYFVVAFAIGFMLGALRTGALTLYPALGRLAAVAIEIPFMLTACWLICGQVVARFSVPAAWPARAALGAVAFALLQGAEMTLGVWMSNIGPAQQFAAFATPAGALGLAAQIAYGVGPLLVGVRTFRDTR